MRHVEQPLHADGACIVSESPTKPRVLPIEEVVRWCVRDELPKRRDDVPISAPPAAGMHPMWRGGVFGARIDNWSREPGMPLAMGDPHPDALVIEAAIYALTPADLDLDAYDIGRGLDPRCNLAMITERARRSAIAWIVTLAKRGGRPDYGTGPECEPAMGTRGQVTLWVTETREAGRGGDGTPWFTTHDATTTPVRAGTYRPGTFCKLMWTRDSNAVADDRAVYAAWHAALTILAARLKTLTTITVRPPAAPATPWIEPPPASTTLLSLVPVNDTDLTPHRHTVARPRTRPAAPVRRVDPATYPPLRAAA